MHIRSVRAGSPPDMACLEPRLLLSGTVEAQGIFTGWPDYAAGVSGGGTAVTGDLNADGRADVVLQGANNDLLVLLGAGDGSFAAPLSIPLGTQTGQIALGDMNGDGKLDIVASTRDAADQVTLVLGNGDGTFGAPASTPIALSYEFLGCAGMSLVDMNHDGHLDVVGLYPGMRWVGIFLGDGAGGFLTNNPTFRSTGSGPMRMSVADFDLDGKLDLAVLESYANTVSVMYGDGAGDLSRVDSFPVEELTYGLGVADVDGNGRPDLVTGGGRSGNLSVRLNKAGGFDSPILSPTDYQCEPLLLADVSGDGVSDALTANGLGIGVALGLGGGRFAERQTVATGGQPKTLAVADLNGDGRLDILSGQYNGQLAVLMGAGGGAFSPVPIETLPSGPQAMAVGDLDGDGKPDVVTANPGRDGVSVVLGAAGGSLGAQRDFPAGLHPEGVAVGDVNGDGKLDVVTANAYSNDVTVLLGNGDGTLGAPRRFAAGGGPSAVALGDLNGDHKLDVVVTNRTDNTVSILLGDGAGSFSLALSHAVGTGPAALALGDMDGDGKLDIVTANYGANTVSVLLGDGAGGVASAASFATGGLPSSVSLGDIDKDGRLDVMTADAWGSPGQVSVLLGTGGGNLAAAANYSLWSGPESAALGDINNDGWLDIVAVSDTSSYLHVLTNKGDGTFNPETWPPLDSDRTSVLLTDLNGDGNLDLLATGNRYDDILVLRGSGDGTFTTSSSVPGPAGAQRIFTDDMNRDGHADLTFVNPSTGEVTVQFGAGNGTYGAPASYSFGALVDDVQVADLNGGGPEIVAVNEYNKGLAILWNDGSGRFGSAATKTINDGPRYLAIGDVSGGDADIVTADITVKSLTVLVNAGGGAFATKTVTLDNYPGPLAIGDVTGDGNGDLVVWVNYALRVYPGDGAGNFSAYAEYPMAVPSGGEIRLVDLNADGHLDIAYIDGGGNVNVLLNTGTGAFGDALTTDIYGAGRGRFGDINGDGKLDVAVVNSDGQSVAVALGLGDGTFGTPQYCAATGYPTDVALADLNEDGKLDAVTVSANPARTGVLMNNGWGLLGANFEPVGLATRATGLQLVDVNSDGRLEIAAWDDITHNFLIASGMAGGLPAFPQSFSPREAKTQMAVGDVTGDGKPDLVAIDDGYRVFVVPQEADGRYRKMLYLDQSAQSHGQTALAVGDVTGDGLGDIVTTETISDNYLVVRASGGLGAFAAPVRYELPDAPSQIELADLNGDGRKDVIVLSTDGSAIYTLMQYSDGTLAPAVAWQTTSGPSRLAIADVTGESVLDAVLLIPGDNQVEILPGDGSGGFLSPTNVAVEASTIGLAVGDVTGDAVADLVTWTEQVVSVRAGLGSALFQAPVPFAAATTIRDAAIGDMTGDGVADLVLAEYYSIEVRPNLKPWTKAADLAIAAPAQTPVYAQTGHPYTLSVRLTDTGTAPASNIPVDVYLANDANVDAGDTLAGSANCGWLAMGGVRDQGVTFTAPALAGTYYLRARVNGSGAVVESNIANNWGDIVTLVVSNTPPPQPDLTISAPLAANLPVTTSQQVSISVAVDNGGNASAGAFSVGLYLSTDSTVTTADQRVGGFDLSSFGAGGHQSQNVVFTAPSNPGTWYVAAIADTAGQVAESSESNNTGQVVTLTVQQAPAAGDVAINGSTVRSVRYTDSDGTTVTVGLTGTGATALLHLEGTSVVASAPVGGVVTVSGAGNQVWLDHLTINNGTSSTNLTISTVESATSTLGTSIGDVTVNGSLGTFSARTTDLDGNLGVTGSLGTLTVRDLSGTIATLGGTLTTATVQNWFGGYLEGVTVGTLTVKGEFSPNVTLSGPTKAGTKAIGTATISGSLTGTWDITGPVGSITSTGETTEWQLGTQAGRLTSVDIGLTLGIVESSSIHVDGKLASLKALSWHAGTISAGTLAALSITGKAAVMGAGGITISPAIAGNFVGGLALSGKGATATAQTLGTASIAGNLDSSFWDITGKVGSITVGGTTSDWQLGTQGGALTTVVTGVTLGQVQTGSVYVDQKLASLKAINWSAGTISAGTLGTFSITGKAASATGAAIPGIFGAELVLSGKGATSTTNTLGAAAVAGNLDSELWDITGQVGSITVGGTTSDWQLGTQGGALTAVVTGVTLGQVQTATVYVDQKLVSLKAINWNAGTISAGTLGTLNITGKAPVGTAQAVPGFFGADVALSGKGAAINANTLGTATIAGDLLAPGGTQTWSIVGKAGTITVNGNTQHWHLGSASGQLTAVTTLTLGTVANTSVVVDKGIATLRASRWDAGTISAGSIGTLSVTGKAGVPARGTIPAVPAIPGNIGAAIDLSGNGVAARGLTLGSATVAGDLLSNLWKIAGSVGTINVVGTVEDWALGQTGSPITSANSLTFGIVTDAALCADKAISSLRAVSWAHGAVRAGAIGTLSITGKAGVPARGAVPAVPGVSGDIGATISLTGNGVTAGGLTLGSATIAGSLISPNWSIVGKAGSLSISRLLASMDLPGANLTSIKTSDPLVRVLVDGIPQYLLAVKDDGTLFPIHFASLAQWPKTICDQSIASGDPQPTSQDVLGSMTLASLKNHMVSSGLGTWTGDPSRLSPGLVASYAPTSDPNYRYVSGISYVYDDSLAIQALLVGTPNAECRGRAFQIADALVLLQDRDPMNASAVPDAEFGDLRPAPLRDGYGVGIVAASRTAATVTVRNVGITRTSSGNQAYVAMALLRAGDVAESAGGTARAADYRKTAKELLLYVARNRSRPGPLDGFGLSNDPTIGTARSTEHNVDLAAAFDRVAAKEASGPLKTQWEAWRDWASSFQNQMYGPNERFSTLGWISSGWNYLRAGTDTGDGINKDLVPIDVGAWSYLALGDTHDVPFDLLEFLATSTDAKGRTYTGFDPGFRAVADDNLTNRRDGVGSEVTAYVVLMARSLGDTAILASLPGRASLTPDEQTAYDRIVAMAGAGGTDHDLADSLVSQMANMQLNAPNTDGLGLVAAAVRNVDTGETGSILVNGWSLASTSWARFAYAGWNVFSESTVA